MTQVEQDVSIVRETLSEAHGPDSSVRQSFERIVAEVKRLTEANDDLRDAAIEAGEARDMRDDG